MLTEDEAKTKECCGPNGCGSMGNPRPDGLSYYRVCSASACMAWRWQPTHIRNPDNPDGGTIWSARTYGFCGLAGDSPPLPVGGPPR